ncbi:MAG: glycosyl hydrolase family 18 protein, partial [Bacillota bacterium]
IGRFLGLLDRGAAWLDPRLESAQRWAMSLSRQERAAIAVAAVAFAFLGRSLASLPPTELVPARSIETAAFFENGWGGVFPSSFPALKRLAETGGGRGVDVIYPVWHTVMPGGTVESAASSDVLAYCRSRGIAVIPVVTNTKIPGGDNSGVLKDPAAMRRAVQTLASEVEVNGYDGLNLSFELVPPEYKRRLTEFATALSVAMKDRGRLFVVSVFPDTEMSAEISGAYDYSALGKVADSVVLMAYDRHWAGSGEGPVAPLGWVDAAIRRTARLIPVSKMSLGVGLYGYDWPTVPGAGKPEYLPSAGAVMRAEAQGARIQWDSASMEPFYVYDSGGAPRTVRFLDRTAAALRVGLARKYGLRGVALWRLGFEEQ